MAATALRIDRDNRGRGQFGIFGCHIGVGPIDIENQPIEGIDPIELDVPPFQGIRPVTSDNALAKIVCAARSGWQTQRKRYATPLPRTGPGWPGATLAPEPGIILEMGSCHLDVPDLAQSGLDVCLTCLGCSEEPWHPRRSRGGPLHIEISWIAPL